MTDMLAITFSTSTAVLTQLTTGHLGLIKVIEKRILNEKPTQCNPVDFTLDLDSRILASVNTYGVVDGGLVDHNVLVAIEIFLRSNHKCSAAACHRRQSKLTTTHLEPSNSSLGGFFPAKADGFAGRTGFLPRSSKTTRGKTTRVRPRDKKSILR